MKSTASFRIKTFLSKFLILIFLVTFFPKILLGQKIIKLLPTSSENKSNNNLIPRLIHDVKISNLISSCHKEIGVFIFKVNNSGKVNTKEVRYMGTLVDSTKQVILANIKSVSGKPKRSNNYFIKKNHWYIFKFSTKGDLSKCNDKTVIEILKQIENNDNFYWTAINAIFDNLSIPPNKITFISYETPTS